MRIRKKGQALKPCYLANPYQLSLLIVAKVCTINVMTTLFWSDKNRSDLSWIKLNCKSLSVPYMHFPISKLSQILLLSSIKYHSPLTYLLALFSYHSINLSLPPSLSPPSLSLSLSHSLLITISLSPSLSVSITLSHFFPLSLLLFSSFLSLIHFLVPHSPSFPHQALYMELHTAPC